MDNIQYIEIIKNCPYCNSKLIITNDNGVKILRCPNENCSQRLTNKIEHFCSKNHGLDIKGLGKQTISLLVDWGWLNGLTDIFRLKEHKAEWKSKAGFGEASVSKILNAIDAERRHQKLDAFISALGIPLVGRTVAREIVKYYNTWGDFRNAVGGDWTQFDGFGPEISKAINNFDYSEADEIAAEMLDFKQPEVQPKETPTAAGINFCVTGKITNWKNRDELKSYIESIGGKVTSSVTSKTNYLINNDSTSTSSKNLSAQKLGIPIITEAEFIDAFGQSS